MCNRKVAHDIGIVRVFARCKRQRPENIIRFEIVTFDERGITGKFSRIDFLRVGCCRQVRGKKRIPRIRGDALQFRIIRIAPRRNRHGALRPVVRVEIFFFGIRFFGTRAEFPYGIAFFAHGFARRLRDCRAHGIVRFARSDFGIAGKGKRIRRRRIDFQRKLRVAIREFSLSRLFNLPPDADVFLYKERHPFELFLLGG